MNCPACTTVDLHREHPGGGPAVYTCGACRGRWLAFHDHLKWLESGDAGASAAGIPAAGAGSNGGGAPNADLTGASTTSTSSQPSATEAAAKARRCPRCGTMLGRYRISPDNNFWLERCGSCAGIWFDRGEWEATASVIALARIQHLFNDTHQHKIAAELRARQQEQRYRTLVGDEAFTKVQQFKTWLDSQGRKDVLRAILDDRHDDRT